MDSFHVVEWANAALDEVRIKAWRDANAIVKALEEKHGKISKGKPAKDNRNVQKILNARKEAYDIKGSSFAVVKHLSILLKGREKRWKTYVKVIQSFTARMR